MAAGASPAAPAQDDWRIKPGETLWRLLDRNWYRVLPGNTHSSVIIDTFLDEVSLIRKTLVSERWVDLVKGGRFANHGIIELSEREIRAISGCWLIVSADSDWPNDAHVLIYRDYGKSKRLRLRHPEPPILTSLANDGRSFLRPPKP